MAKDKKIDELKRKIEALEQEINSEKKKDLREKQKEEKTERFIPMKVLYSWKSASRVFVKRDRAWFLKVAVVALLFIILFAFLQDFIVILVICVIVLITFLLGSVPPGNVQHKISNKGVWSIDRMYKWKELEEFWVAEKSGKKIIYIKTNLKFPTRLVMLLAKANENRIVKLLGDKMDYKEFEEKQNWMSKISDGVMVDPKKYESLFTRKKTTSRKSKRRKKS